MAQKALLVGITDYPSIGAENHDLCNCVNDVREVAHSLVALGIFPPTPEAMSILTDRSATKDAILDGLKWLAQGAKKGDLLLFHYSGLTSQHLEQNGEESAGRDESICPHDYVSAGIIRNDDLQSIFKGLATVGIWMLFSTPASRVLGHENSLLWSLHSRAGRSAVTTSRRRSSAVPSLTL